MKRLLVISAMAFCVSANAYDVTSELNLGRHGETQLRLGLRYDLSHQWSLDNGVSVIKYNGLNDEVGVVDSTIQYRKRFRKFYFDAGTGLAMWTQKNWDEQKSATQWTFSNRFGVGYQISKRMEAGMVWRHYSNLCFSPNTSKDFVGFHIAYHF